MASNTIVVHVTRASNNVPWGFRMKGGKDFGCPLTIDTVASGGPADNSGLKSGDMIVKIADQSSAGMIHHEALNIVKRCQLQLSFEVSRQSGTRTTTQSPPSQPPATTVPQQHTFQPAATNPIPSNTFHGLPPRPILPDNPPSKSNENSLPFWSKETAGNKQNAAPSSQTAPIVKPSFQASAGLPSDPGNKPNYNVQQKTNLDRLITEKQGVSGSRTPKCHVCKDAIRGPYLLVNDRCFCPEHFTCSHCGKRLDTSTFVEGKDDKVYCQEDYAQLLAERCAACSEPILRNSVSALGKFWHPACFVCSHCRQPIRDGVFRVGEDSATSTPAVYCEKDYVELIQMKCRGCNFPIEGDELFIETADGGYHSNCFTCTSCKVNLQGKPVASRNNKIYCAAHARTDK